VENYQKGAPGARPGRRKRERNFRGVEAEPGQGIPETCSRCMAPSTKFAGSWSAIGGRGSIHGGQSTGSGRTADETFNIPLHIMPMADIIFI
jgi:hypothetical protein